MTTVRGVTHKELAALRSMTAEQAKVLSVYLDTDAATSTRNDKMGRLSQALRRCAGGLMDKLDQQQFDIARHRVEGFLAEHEAHGKGLILFCGPPGGLWWTGQVQVGLTTQVRFAQGAWVQPLADLFTANPRYCIALVDVQQARLLIAQMGVIEERREIVDEVPKRHKQTEFNPRVERHHAVAVQRHLRNVVDAVGAWHRERKFDRLIIGGPSEALHKFERELPDHLSKLLIARISPGMYATDQQVLDDALAAVPSEEKQATGPGGGH